MFSLWKITAKANTEPPDYPGVFFTQKKHSPQTVLFFGDPREIRTPDTLIRSQVLYPAELLGHMAGAEGLKPPTYGFGDRCSINCAMPLQAFNGFPLLATE